MRNPLSLKRDLWFDSSGTPRDERIRRASGTANSSFDPMKIKHSYLVAGLIVMAPVVWLWHRETLNAKPPAAPRNPVVPEGLLGAQAVERDRPQTSVSASGSNLMSAAHAEEVRKGLSAIFDGLKQMGATEVPPVAVQLKAAVESGDSGKILRAFHEAIYGRFAQMSATIPAVELYLNSPDPYVRYLAAETLTKIGEPAGVDGLLAFIGSVDPILHNGHDLRLETARLLGRYGDVGASSALANLYDSTKDGGVLNARARVESRNPSSRLLADITGQRSPGFVVFNLGLVGLPQGEAVARDALKDPKVPSIFVDQTKRSAAWALARNLKDETAQSFLIEAARPAMERRDVGAESYDNSAKALMYLGSVQSPQAVAVLEEALDSLNPVAVRYATVNLLFNQPGGSPKAEQLLIQEFKTAPRLLGTDLAMQIASKSRNPEVRAAAESFARRTGSDRWRYWGVERANWPVQNWIFDYVVVLNP